MNTFRFPDIVANSSIVEAVSNTDIFRSPLTGAIQTNDRTGEHLGLTLQFNNKKNADARQLKAIIGKLNGQANRVVLRDHSYEKPTGTLSSIAEMVDVTFSATNWTPSGSANGSVSDISSGVRFKGGRTYAGVHLVATASADGISAPTAGYSYAAKLHVGKVKAGSGGQVDEASLRWLDASLGNVLASTDQVSTDDAEPLVVGATCTDASSFFLRPFLKKDGLSDTFGMMQDLGGLSASRCLLVDNGFNALTYSEQFDNAAWAKTRSSISANATSAPDGLTSADELVEDSTASNTHYMVDAYTRASQAEFWTASLYIKSNTRNRVRMGVHSINTSVDGATATFDASSGTITQAVAASGTGSLPYATIDDVGNGWYRCRVTCMLEATTYVHLIAFLADDTGNTTYNGDGSSGLYVWGAQLQRGGQLGRYTETAGAITTGSNQTGKEIWVKGLNHAENQQMLAGDQIEINGQLVILDQDLDGDESGVGLAVVSPRIRNAPADETPAIIYRPHGTFLLDGPQSSWSNTPGGFMTAALKFIEDIAS